MRFILKESQLGFLLEQISYDPNVEIIQKNLKKKLYYLGKYCPNKDGVYGKL